MASSIPPTRRTSASSATVGGHESGLEKGVSSMEARTDLGMRKRPWRRYVTPWERIASHQYAGKGTEQDPYVVSWLKDDAENPMTWGGAYQWTVALTVAFTTFIVAFASSAYSGAITAVRADFPGYSSQVYTLGVSNFVLGFVFGPLLWGPLSEIYGRRKLFIVSYIGFAAFNGGAVASQNIWTIAILRFFAGFFGSSPLTNAGGTISDMFTADKRGLGMAVFASAPFLGPAAGPIAGGFLSVAGWRWVLGLIAILTAVLLAFGTVFMPETYAPVLLQQRADALSKASGKVYRSVFEKSGKKELSVLFKVALSRPWRLLFTEPIVLLLAVYCAIIYGVLYMLFAAFPIVFQQERGWSPGIGGLSFVGLLVGLILALLYMIFYENPRYVRVAKAHGGFAPPEARLPPACIGGICLPIGMFWFAWTASPASIHWSIPIIAAVPFGFGLCSVFLAVMSYLIDAYLLFAVSALAANSVLRSLFGFAFPLFTTNMYASLGVNWASSIPAFLALACCWMPFAFYKYGATIRQKCKFSAEAARMWEQMRDATEAQNKSTPTDDHEVHEKTQNEEGEAVDHEVTKAEGMKQ